MNVLKVINFIINHPLNENNKFSAFSRFLKWQINTIINYYPIIYNFTDKSFLVLKKGMTGATGNLYCGLHEYEEMFFLLHFLKDTDLFVDIGANIGSYTVLASAHINAHTISIEPVPSTYENLITNVSINRIQNLVSAYNIALGSKKGNLKFTKSEDTTNHVATEHDKDTIMVKVDTLDDLLLNRGKPVLIKVDVEGFETEVLNGATNTLNNSDLKAIIIELNGSGERYNYDELLIHKKLVSLEFRPYKYNPLFRLFTEIDTYGKNNTIYIRDIDFVKKRVQTSPRIKILNKEI